MFFFNYELLPGPEHPDRATYGATIVACWIDRSTIGEAEEVVVRELVGDGWTVIGQASAEAISPDDYEEGDEALDFYRQAETDGEVFVFHTSPRFPVFRFTALVNPLGSEAMEHCRAHYFLVGEALRNDDEDIYDPEFWSTTRVGDATRAAVEAIHEAGWNVVKVVESGPCGRQDLDDNLVDYYDQAEEDGASLFLEQQL